MTVETEAVTKSLNTSKNDFRTALPQILAVAVKNKLLLTYGLTLGFSAILIPNLKENNSENLIEVTKEEISWIGSINLIAVPIGCFLSGLLTQPLGRRLSMRVVTIPFFVSWLIFYFAEEVYQLYIALILTGLAGGLLEAPVLTYVAEITQPHVRGMLAATSTMSIVFGQLIPLFFGTVWKWRTISIVCTIFPVMSLILLFFVPESPHWLISKHRLDEARKSLAWLRGWTTEENIEHEYKELCAILSNSETKPSNTSVKQYITNLIENYTKRSFLLPFFLLNFSLFVGLFSGAPPILTYSVSIFRTLETPIDEYYAAVFMGLMQVAGCILCVSLVHYIGKRPIVLVTMVASGICLILLGTTSYIANIHSVVLDVRSNASQTFSNTTNSINSEFITENTWIGTTLLIVAAFLIYAGIRLLPWMLIGEIYPNSCRAGAAAVSSTMFYVYSFIANKVFLNMVDAMTFGGTFWFFGALNIVGAIVLYFILPETEGRTLIEIEMHYNGGPNIGKKMKKKTSKTCDEKSNGINYSPSDVTECEV